VVEEASNARDDVLDVRRCQLMSMPSEILVESEGVSLNSRVDEGEKTNDVECRDG
jgi:hypothetical protein